ncbi:eukaryotic translation initiation factor 5A-1-like [Saccoglossus kowalevskii]|uniref:Eukaryotic translation initiation factor 5A n=1 Tax=Saccoglossus kowalevskii TaxID=10224 RepID=A0ABM0M0V0_SACKO|nr:PREDICTED: eukaryotic translation initiation factor 5A-1-like [Saccoglossus kowalevskii]
MADDHDFHSGESGASETYPAQCSSLRKNGHVLLKGRPCKIVEMSTSKTGKHGHAKVHMVGIDLFTQKKYEDICPSTHNMNVPIVNRKDFQLLDIVDGYLSLLEDDSSVRDDIKNPSNELGKEIADRFANEEQLLVTVLSAMGHECAISVKNCPK